MSPPCRANQTRGSPRNPPLGRLTVREGRVQAALASFTARFAFWKSTAEAFAAAGGARASVPPPSPPRYYLDAPRPSLPY
jgi:hypothetical protein